MDKKIIEKSNMFTNVDAVFTQYALAIDEVPALKAQVTIFKAGLMPIAQMMQLLSLDSKGNAAAKKAAEVLLAKRGARICGMMKSYAKDQQDLVLYAQVKYSASAFEKLRDLELQQAGQAIYDLANGLAAQLLDYGVKAADLTDLKNAVDNYTLLNPKVRQVKVDRKTTRQLLFKKVGEMNNLLRFKIDNGMKVMEFSEAAFYSLYVNARRNYSVGGRQQAPEAELLAEVSQPVAAEKKNMLQGMLGDLTQEDVVQPSQVAAKPSLNGV